VTASDKIALGLAIASIRDIIKGAGNPKHNAHRALYHLNQFKEVRDLIDEVVETLEKN
jgi:hypothetical protein